MSTSYEKTGRIRQKARTRSAMLAATRAHLAEGVTPTVEQAADRAGVSRTTAYRYFPNQRAMLLAVYPELDEASVLPADAPRDDPVLRLELVTERIAAQIVDNEPQLRAMLRLSLEQPSAPPEVIPLRQGRAIGWLQDALAPLGERMTQTEIRRLALAIRATLGIESLVWLTDVAGVSRQEAVDIMRSSARALLRVALDELSVRPAGACTP